MLTLYLTWNQIAVLELFDVEYTRLNEEPDGFTHGVGFPSEAEYSRALEVLTKRW